VLLMLTLLSQQQQLFLLLLVLQAQLTKRCGFESRGSKSGPLQRLGLGTKGICDLLCFCHFSPCGFLHSQNFRRGFAVRSLRSRLFRLGHKLIGPCLRGS